MAAKSMDEAVTSPGDVANVFAPGVSDDDDAELAKLHGDDDEDDEVNEDNNNYHYYTVVLCQRQVRLQYNIST